jgi:hypothetical protein
VYFVVFLSRHLSTAFTAMLLEAGSIWHPRAVSLCVLGDMRNGRIFSNSRDHHMQGKGDFCDLRHQQLCCWKCKSSVMWHYVIQYVVLDTSRELQCFKTSGNTCLESQRYITEEPLLQTLLGAMPLMMLMWNKVLSGASLPW